MDYATLEYELGDGNRVVEDAELVTETRALAARLAAARTLESYGQSILIRTADHREGVTVFREKRRPRFEGH